MSNVVAFKKVEEQKPSVRTQKSMTLFVHIKQTTLIAHCGDLQSERASAQGCVGKSRF